MLASIRRYFTGRSVVRPALLLAGALALGACDDDDPIDPGPTTEWAADLAGEGDYEEVTGAVVVLSSESAFSAEIEIDGAADGDVFVWGVFAGTCTQPGDRVGDAADYPELEADGNGAAAADAEDSTGLAAGEDYIVRITEESGEEPVVVACSALAEEDE